MWRQLTLRLVNQRLLEELCVYFTVYKLPLRARNSMTRQMTVVSERRAKDEPCIRIADKQLAIAGFSLGDLISVTIKPQTVIIKRLNKMNHE